MLHKADPPTPNPMMTFSHRIAVFCSRCTRFSLCSCPQASLEHAEVKAWVKAEGVMGIPHLSVYGSKGQKLMGMGASFNKMDILKANLGSIAQHREAVLADGHELQLDPNLFVVLPESAIVAQ
jgi:hypothetical protein